MTQQRTFKRRVRSRMAKTGESYTAARRQLIESGERPPAPEVKFEPPVSEEAVRKATGSGWQEWFALLDEWGALGRPHLEIARWLQSRPGVSGWWSQSITVAYERARGLREPGQRPDGWVAGASKTVAVPVTRLFRAVVDDVERERWLPGAELGLRTATEPRTARYDWEDGSTRVVFGFDELGESKARVALQHERLPDGDSADEMKAWWRERFTELKAMLEGESEGGNV